MRRVLFFIATLALCAQVAAQSATQSPVNEQKLKSAKANIASVRNGVAARDAVIAQADRLMSRDIQAVTEKEPSAVAAGGDPHDYVSMGPYYWRNPSTPDGMPYVMRDGERNPELRKYDRGKIDTLKEAITALTYAYHFTGNEKYAKKAVGHLHKFFINPATRMNPNLRHAQMIPGRDEGRGRAAGVIDTYCFVELVDCIDMLSKSKSMSQQDNKALRQWFSDMVDWLLTSSIGRAEDNATNNHSIAYDAQVMAYAIFAGRDVVAKEILGNYPKRRLFVQIQPDGSQPRELQRTMAVHYTIYNIDHMLDIAQMARRMGIENLIELESEDGRSVAGAMAFIVPYLGKQRSEFPYNEIGDWEANQQKIVWALYRFNQLKPTKGYDELFQKYCTAAPDNIKWLIF